jgi:predicted RNA-binding protein with PIN domain
MGNEAKKITVVTSDRHIQAQVRSTGANIMASQAFAAVLAAPMEPDREASKIEKPLSDSEVDQWLDIFKGKSSN